MSFVLMLVNINVFDECGEPCHSFAYQELWGAYEDSIILSR